MTEFASTYTVDCPKCESGRVVKVGMQSGHQRFLCKDCKSKFRLNKVKGRKFNDEQMGSVLRDYYTGKSYKEICEGMEDRENIPEPAKDTVYQWVREFTDVATETMRDYKARSSGDWVADEIVVRCGGRNMYLWNIMDKKTKYLYATHLSIGRGTKDAKIVIRKALEAADQPPKRITTDGWDPYKPAVRDLMSGAEHNVSEGIRAANNNNISERLQGTIRDRELTMRGLDTLESGQRFFDGWQLTYNLFKEHETLGFKTPGEVAFEELPFKEWADVVRSGKRAPKDVQPRTPKTGISKERWRRWVKTKSSAPKRPKADMSTIPTERPAGPQQMGFPELVKMRPPTIKKPIQEGRPVRAGTKAKPRRRRRG